MPKKNKHNFNPDRINAKRQKLLRDEQTEKERNQSREVNKCKQSVRRSNVTSEETEFRLKADRLRKFKKRTNESSEETEARLAENRLRNSTRRINESSEETEARLAEDRLRNSTRRINESSEETEARLAEDRLRNSTRRINESFEETEARLAEDRLRNSTRRINESFEETEARLAENRLRNSTRRKDESSEEIEARLADNRMRKSSKQKTESSEETVVRRDVDRLRKSKSRTNKISEKKKEPITSDRQRVTKPRAVSNTWQHLMEAAFKYDSDFEYANFPPILIGSMSVVCPFCNALKFEGEAPGLCCSNGKISLPELPELPEPLKSLMNGDHPMSKEFLNKIRKYNCSFQMTSFGTTSAAISHSTGFQPTFKIQGQVYHKIGSLLPLPEEDPKFLQIYFLGDEEIETERRCKVIPGTNKNLINSLQKMLHVNNHYVQQFKMALDTNLYEDLQIVIKADKKPVQGHSGVFNAPLVNEVAIIIAGNDFEKRDIVLTMRSNELKNISETHISYDALQYPLMFPRGEDGYAINIQQVKTKDSKAVNKMVSAMSYYCYRLMVRRTTNRLLNYRQLLHQYLVDMYVKIETERLLFIRLNQKKLRVDDYIHLKDAIVNDGNSENHGKMVILPSTYTGGPRNMHEYAQDAITYVRHGGKPSLFITYTFNPNCSEVKENLVNGQSRTDRHDLVARIFRQKLIKIINVLTKGKVFGSVKYWLYSVEWQKRGLPHAHILIWLTNGLKTSQMDSIISAEIPDPIIDKKLHAIVIKNMVHGPCGALNWKSPCMKDKVCSKKFPRQFVKETQTLIDGYPLYRRRKPEDGGQTANIRMKSENVQIDNRWIVPYSPLLLKMFDAYINVECCNSVKSIKYILKYVHKGSDQGVFTTTSGKGEVDEVSEFQTGRYISSNEAAWRIFGFPIHERYPTVMHLDVHLENGQRIYFNEGNLQNILANPPNTTLTGFFELCRSDDFAKTLLYCEVPRYYTWDKSKKVFQRRKQGEIVDGYVGIISSEALGRVYTVHVRNFECYYLRMLLHKIKGPTCFKDLRTVDGLEHDTYHAACLTLGLLENDNQWDETLKEAKESDSPSQVRNLFAVILSFCEPSNPKLLWKSHKDCMSEDILNRRRQENPRMTFEYSQDIYNEALIKVEDKVLEMIGKTLSDIGMTSPSRQISMNLNREMIRELSYDSDKMRDYVQQNEPLLNPEQLNIYQEVLRRYKNDEGGVIFIDAPGGTGKTFLINLLLARIRAEKKIALAVASSGIAAMLMTGGRTAHSTLQIPIDLIHNEAPVCNIKKGSGRAKVLMEVKVLFWDEISMMHKHGFEAVNRTLQDIRGNKNLLGGLIVVLAGDFRQTLPVIPRGTMVDEIKACLKSSHLWKDVTTMKLSINMRVQQSNKYTSKKFSEYLLKIGDGKEPENQTGKIKISEKFCTICPTLNNLINCVYPNINANLSNRKWLKERAILTPLNVKVEEINNSIQERVHAVSRTFLSIDKCTNEDEATSYPVEFLNSLNPNGVPPHKLVLKVGSPIMLLRNLDPPKLCNGSRLTVKALHAYVIEATILTGPFEGEHVFIPRIPLVPTDLPFSFKRLQFPIRLAFAITINKSQGQSLNVTGLDLTDECFSHGQLYVGMSRAKDPKQLYIVADKEGETKNVVYGQVLK